MSFKVVKKVWCKLSKRGLSVLWRDAANIHNLIPFLFYRSFLEFMKFLEFMEKLQ